MKYDYTSQNKIKSNLTDCNHACGYHLKTIVKGTLGELSKIQEELDELKDAEEQGCKIMQLVELSDLYGAIDHYLGKYFPNISIDDLSKMSYITERAFLAGQRN